MTERKKQRGRNIKEREGELEDSAVQLFPSAGGLARTGLVSVQTRAVQWEGGPWGPLTCPGARWFLPFALAVF